MWILNGSAALRQLLPFEHQQVLSRLEGRQALVELARGAPDPAEIEAEVTAQEPESPGPLRRTVVVPLFRQVQVLHLRFRAEEAVAVPGQREPHPRPVLP